MLHTGVGWIMSSGVWAAFHHGVISLSAEGMAPTAHMITTPLLPEGHRASAVAGTTLLLPSLDPNSYEQSRPRITILVRKGKTAIKIFVLFLSLFLTLLLYHLLLLALI